MTSTQTNVASKQYPVVAQVTTDVVKYPAATAFAVAGAVKGTAVGAVDLFKKDAPKAFSDSAVVTASKAVGVVGLIGAGAVTALGGADLAHVALTAVSVAGFASTLPLVGAGIADVAKRIATFAKQGWNKGAAKAPAIGELAAEKVAFDVKVAKDVKHGVEAAAHEVAEVAEKGAKAVGHAVVETGEAIAEGAEFVAKKAVEGAVIVEKGVEAAVDGACEVAHAVGAEIEKDAKAVAHAAHEAGEAVVEAAKDGVEAVEKGAKAVVDGTVELAKDAGEAIEKGAKAVGNAAREGAHAVADAKADLLEAAAKDARAEEKSLRK